MTTKISTANIQPVTLAALAGGGGPKISQVVVTNSSYANLDDTAVALEGGYVKLIGSGFEAGCQVLVGLTPATSVTFVSDTEVRAQVPATAAGTYIVYLVNADGGTAIRINGITFSGTPTWTSNSALAGVVDAAISIQLTATDAATFALAAGSTLPPGVSLSSLGLLSGTITGIEQETVYNFTINAVDAELQDSPRSFAFTVTAGDQLFAATTLLLPGSATTFVSDASVNNLQVTVVGDTRANTFNPYLTGWSNYVSGGYNTSSSSQLALGTGNFTIEFFIYPLAYNDGVVINWTNGTQGNTGQGFVGFNTNGFIYYRDGSNIVATSSVQTPLNSWTHVAMSRSADTLRIFINGQLTASASTSKDIVDTYLTIGALRLGSTSHAALIDAYLSNLRIVKGTALYTAAFTPPTAPLTAIAGTSLLIFQSNRLIDNSVNNIVLTAYGSQNILQSFSPFQEPATTNGSGYFDGSGDRLIVPSSPNFDFAGDFTIEMWINFANITSTWEAIISRAYGVAGGWRLYKNDGSNQLSWWSAATQVFSTSGSTLANNTWSHIAVVRNSGTVTIYIDGVNRGSAVNATSYTPGDYALEIGEGVVTSTYPFEGYISNLRLTTTAVYTANFTPPTEPLTAVANTSLLTLQTNQPHNNNQFLDSSTNNFPITRAGNATQGTFSPYSPSGWSNYFAGNGNYLTSPSNSAFALGTEDFTIETWIYRTGTNPENATYSQTIFDLRSTEPQVAINIGWDGGNAGYANKIYVYVNGGYPAVSTTTTVINTWYHVAYVRSGATAYLYINGVMEASYALSSNFTTTTCRIGSRFAVVSTDWRTWQGYISNARIVKGTAVYTSNFTPPTRPLTAIAGTSLLTCADNRFVDDSPNNFAVTRAGDVRVTNFAPFKAVTQTPVTYSAYFAGSGSYLTAVGSGSVVRSSGSFTIEGWYYPTSSASSFRAVYSGYFTAGSIWQNNTTLYFYWGPSASLTGTIGWTLNTWNHWAVTWDGTTTRVYVNGQQTISSTSPTYSGTADIIISDFQYPLIGYISNFRVSNSVIYTANFTPPTQPLTAVSGTSLLTCQSPTFVDNSTNNFAITAAGNTQPTTVNPFGSTFAGSAGYTAAEYSGSMYFDGSGDSISVPVNNAIAMKTGNFTIEFWMYQTTSGDNKVILDLFDGNSAGRLLLWIQTSTGQLINKGSFGADRHATATGVITLNNWIHVALVRSAGISRFYINGVQSGSNFTDTTNYTCTAGPVRIGSNQDGTSQPLTGYITDFRMVKGQALYTSNFVPPIAPVEPVANTVLLLNGTSAGITDATTKNVVETVGTARISTAVAKFSGSSMNFASGENLLKILNSDAGVFGTGDFTVEMWAYFPVDLESIGRLIAFTNSADPGAGRLQQNSGNTLYWINASGATGTSIAVSLNTWTHIAVCRSGTTIRYFKDGVQVGSGTDSSNYTVRDIYVASDHSGSWRLTCSIQDLRITKTARYTTNFTPPTTAFQTR